MLVFDRSVFDAPEFVKAITGSFGGVCQMWHKILNGVSFKGGLL